LSGVSIGIATRLGSFASLMVSVGVSEVSTGQQGDLQLE
jgi:hypothetical protein